MKDKRVVAIIEARMNSSRLPGKVLLEMAGKPVIGHIVDRLRAAKQVDDVCVATVADDSCDVLVDYCHSIGVDVFRGSEDDVLDRVLQAAYHSNADVIVEICGDCPVIDPIVVDELVEQYFHLEVDFCSNAIQRVHPLGLDAKVFSRDVLQRVADSTQDKYDREHVSLYIYENPDKFALHHLSDNHYLDVIDYRLTLDTDKDFAMINQVYDALYAENKTFGLAQIIPFLQRNPEIVMMNSDVKQKGARE